MFLTAPETEKTGNKYLFTYAQITKQLQINVMNWNEESSGKEEENKNWFLVSDSHKARWKTVSKT